MKGHDVALWAGVAAFFGSLLAVGIFDVLNPDQVLEYLGALLVAFITAGSVYAKERLEEAKKLKEKNELRSNGHT
jgi:hypothetical protein